VQGVDKPEKLKTPIGRSVKISLNGEELTIVKTFNMEELKIGEIREVMEEVVQLSLDKDKIVSDITKRFCR